MFFFPARRASDGYRTVYESKMYLYYSVHHDSTIFICNSHACHSLNSKKTHHTSDGFIVLLIID